MFQDMHSRDIRVARKFRNQLIATVIMVTLVALIGGFIFGATYALRNAVINHTGGAASMENQSLRMQVHALTIERDAWVRSMNEVATAKK